jgi:hypothetical protein
MPDPASYAEAKARVAGMLAAGRLADPAEHFPYKEAAARQALSANAPAGRLGPDDDGLLVEDYISEDIIDATNEYVRVQAAMLAGEVGRDEYEAAKDVLVQARLEHRRFRGPHDPRTVPIMGGMRYRRYNEGE